MNNKLKTYFVSEDSVNRNKILGFISCFVTGMIAHGYYIYNQIFNMDSVYVPYGMSPILSSGRWAGVIINNIFKIYLQYFLVINSFNIIAGILLLSLCAAQLVEIFNIKKRYVAIIISALLVVQPMIINLVGFTFVFHLDLFAMFLATYTMKLVLVKGKVVLPAVLLGISAGIYQAYIPYAVTIIAVYYFLFILDGNDVKQLIKPSIKCLIVFVATLIIYVVGLKLTIMLFDSLTHEEQQFGYLGMGTNGLPVSSIQNLFLNLFKSYHAFIDIYTGRYGHITNFPIMKLVLILVLLIFIISAVKLLKKIYAINKLNFILSIVFILIIPIIVNIQFAYYLSNTPRVQSGLFFIFFIPLLMLDRIELADNNFDFFKSLNFIKFINIKKLVTNLILYVFIFIAVHFVFVSHGEHYRLFLHHQRYERSLQNIANLIITSKDYKDGMEIIMCGNYKTPDVFMKYQYLYPYDIHDVYLDSSFWIEGSYSFALMQLTNLNIYLQVPQEEREKYKDIPNYPNPDCVQKIDENLLLIKFSD